MLALGAFAVAVAAAIGIGRAPAPPGTIVFIVMDNVRADRLSMCGHDRPTSPNLEAFAADATWTCDAYVPAPWTLPTHATYFTGLEVPEHGAHFSGSSDPMIFDLAARPLGTEPRTLAEDLAARGYRTALVSGNPVVGEASGLTRGFASSHHALGFGKGFGDGLMPLLDAALDDLEAQGEGPAFLFVNIADAHVPWRAVPDGLGWVPKRGRVSTAKHRRSPMGRLVNGDLSEDEEVELRSHMDDIYDYAVYRSDRTLGRVLERLEARGLLTDARVVLTSDHGELLGEHRKVGHCCETLEPLARVPLVVKGFDASLPSPLSASVVHGLVRDGVLPDPLPPLRMAADPNPSWAKRSDRFGGDTLVAGWRGRTKHVWRNGVATVVDLASDPDESAPEPATAPDDLEAFAERFVDSLERGPGDAADLEKRLEALGYVD